jgi:arylsulfatase A
MRFLHLTVLSLFLVVQSSFSAQQPNIVIIFMDDMGYADVSCFGAQGYQTPNIDQLAASGPQVHEFPRRAAGVQRLALRLLTGCYPNRVGIHGALGPSSKHGINAD